TVRPGRGVRRRSMLHLYAEHAPLVHAPHTEDRKSTRLNSSHVSISYAVFCLKKKNKELTLAMGCPNMTVHFSIFRSREWVVTVVSNMRDTRTLIIET